MRFYIVEDRDPWGDYGQMLISGMSEHLERKDGLVQLERTGPYVPPISKSGLHNVIATDALRKKLEASGLAPLEFREVLKTRIVELHWEKWDLMAEEPPQELWEVWDYSTEKPQKKLVGEPEEFILQRPHNPRIAEEIGPLWEVVLPEGAMLVSSSFGKYELIASSWKGHDFFYGRLKGSLPQFGLIVVASEKGKKWLEEIGEGWLKFESIPVKYR